MWGFFPMGFHTLNQRANRPSVRIPHILSSQAHSNRLLTTTIKRSRSYREKRGRTRQPERNIDPGFCLWHRYCKLHLMTQDVKSKLFNHSLKRVVFQTYKLKHVSGPRSLFSSCLCIASWPLSLTVLPLVKKNAKPKEPCTQSRKLELL